MWMKTASQFRCRIGVQDHGTASSGEVALPFTSHYPRDFFCLTPAILQHQQTADSCFPAMFALVWILPEGLGDLPVELGLASSAQPPCTLPCPAASHPSWFLSMISLIAYLIWYNWVFNNMDAALAVGCSSYIPCSELHGFKQKAQCHDFWTSFLLED